MDWTGLDPLRSLVLLEHLAVLIIDSTRTHHSADHHLSTCLEEGTRTHQPADWKLNLGLNPAFANFSSVDIAHLVETFIYSEEEI